MNLNAISISFNMHVPICYFQRFKGITVGRHICWSRCDKNIPLSDYLIKKNNYVQAIKAIVQFVFIEKYPTNFVSNNVSRFLNKS